MADDDKYILSKAQTVKEVLLAQGWNRTSMTKSTDQFRRGKTSPVCLMGAVNQATTGIPWKSNTGSRKLMLAVGRHIPDGRLIDDWNDDPDTEFEDVLHVIDDVIQELT